MSSSPTNVRILRSHARKPSEDNKEKEAKPNSNGNNINNNLTPTTNNIITTSPNNERESEKEKRKRKGKSPSSLANSSEAEQVEGIDLNKTPNKPNKKKRKLGNRTAHSDGEQEYVELDEKKPGAALLKTRPSPAKIEQEPSILATAHGGSISAPINNINNTTTTTSTISNNNSTNINDSKMQNIMEPIYTLRATLASVLAKLPKPSPAPSSSLPPSNNYVLSPSSAPFTPSNNGFSYPYSREDSAPPSSSPPSSLALASAPSVTPSLSASFNAISSNLNALLGLASNITSAPTTPTPPSASSSSSSASQSLFQQPTTSAQQMLSSPSQQAAPSQPPSQTQQGPFWGSLMSQYPHHPNIPLSGTSYSIGRRTSRCTMALPDDFLSTILCKIHYSNGVATIESCSGSSSLQLNNQPIRKGYTLVLRSGDELSFTGSKHYSFIFQLYNTTTTSTSPNSAFPSPIPTPSSAPPSLPASSSVASTSAPNIFSFLDVEKSLSSPPQPDPSSSFGTPKAKAAKGLDMASSPDEMTTLEGDDQTNTQTEPLSPPPASPIPTPSKSDNAPPVPAPDSSSFLTPQKAAPAPQADSPSPPLPFPSLPSTSTTTTTTTSTTTSTPTTVTPTTQPPEQNSMKEAYKNELKELIITPHQTTHTLEAFPYYLAKETKQMLISAAFLFLTKPEYVKYTSDLASVSRRILLEGPTGTDLYQETLVKALAKQFNANLLIIDNAYFDAKEKWLSLPTSSSSSSSVPSSSPAAPSLPALSSRHALPELGPEDDDSEYSSEEYGRSRLNPFDTSKRRFKIDDRVKYTGPSPASFAMGRHHSSSAASSLHSGTPSSSNSNSDPQRVSSHRGPQIGNKGKVVITFDDNPRKVGVRFDKTIAGGVDLGGLCEESHGFFVDTSEIKRESETADDRPDTLAITGLFEMLSTTTTPTILYIKEAEKVLLANYERYAHIKREFTRINKSTSPVIIIGGNRTAAVSESRRGEKGHGSSLLFSKAASHHTALLDLSFFDHISRIEERAKETSKTTKFLYKMLPNKITITPPKDPTTLIAWREKLEKDVEQIKLESNVNNIRKVLDRNNIECSNLNSNLLKKQIFNADSVEKIVGWAVSHHLMNPDASSPPLPSSPPSSSPSSTPTLPEPPVTVSTPPTPSPPSSSDQTLPSSPIDPMDASPTTPSPSTTSSTTSTTPTISTTSTTSTTPTEKLEITIKSIDYAVEMLTSHDPDNKAVKNLKEVETENEFEKRILTEVIPPHEIAIRFEDIGALGKVKETLKELVMLPLQRPELFRKGNLTKPCKGILLFGPPGTGKTMLAKAVATESGANFINVSMSTIGSKWFGEGEKYARAVFTLASKISPSVIFIDEVDSILGKRDRSGEHEAMRKIKNEFMSMWDGLRSREGERVLVLAATNRPFDLDDAVLRRLPRRLMVDLPDQENRVKILQVILAKEELDPTVDFPNLASMTDGYSGSDLKNLSIAAAYQPIREFLRKEKEKPKEGGGEEEEGPKPEVQLRPISLADFVKAKEEVSPSVSEDAFSIAELRKWNESYGEGGSRTRSTLAYFT